MEAFKLLFVNGLIIFLSLNFLSFVQSDGKLGKIDYKVVCFWGSWSYYRSGNGKFTPDNIDPQICTHLIYGFAKLNEHYAITPFDPYLDIMDKDNKTGIGCYKQFNKLRDKNPNLKTMIALGDMTDGRKRYLDMISTEDTRKKFVLSVVHFLNKHNFSGLELTWEYPGSEYSDFATEANTINLMLLLKELHEKLTITGHVLSISLSISENNIINSPYNISLFEDHVDFINLLTFGFHGASESEQHTGPNAPLEPGVNDSAHDKKFNIHYAVDHWLNSTKDSRKLVLGIPAFGHSYKLLTQNFHDFGALIKGTGIAGDITKSPGILGYIEICQLKEKEDWTIVNDPNYKVPYMWKDEHFISFDDPNSVKLKIKFLKDKRLGGAIIWTIDTDDFNGNCGFGKFKITSTVMSELNNTLT